MKRFAISLAGLLVVLLATILALKLPLGDSLKLIWEGALGDKYGVSRTLVRTTPLLITGLAMAFAWRGGMFNIGGEGQFVVGGICGAAVAKMLLSSEVPPGAAAYIVLMACVAGGAAYALVAAWLAVYRGVSVVIGTIMLNFVAIQLLDWVSNGPLQERTHSLPQSDQLPQIMMLARFDRQVDLHSGIFIAFILIPLAWTYLFSTKWGFHLRLVGANALAARAAKVNTKRVQLSTMAISGGLCGLAGGIEYLGTAGQIGSSFSQNWGFLAIPVALLGALHPLGILGSALFFGALFAGSEQLGRFSTAGTTLVYIVQGVSVLGLMLLEGYRSRRLVPEAA